MRICFGFDLKIFFCVGVGTNVVLVCSSLKQLRFFSSEIEQQLWRTLSKSFRLLELFDSIFLLMAIDGFTLDCKHSLFLNEGCLISSCLHRRSLLLQNMHIEVIWLISSRMTSGLLNHFNSWQMLLLAHHLTQAAYSKLASLVTKCKRTKKGLFLYC